MAEIANKVMAISQSISEDDFLDFDGDISIALEYTGLPVNPSSIPCAVPVDVDRIPTAKVIASPGLFSNDSSFPVAEPVVRVSTERRIGNSDDQDGFDRNGDLNGAESSGPLGFSDSREHSNVVSESSDMVETPVGCEQIEGFINQAQWNSNELSMTPQGFSNELSLTPHGFSSEVSCDHDSGQVSGCQEEFVDEEGEFRTPERPVPEKPAKKGMCYHCHRGNRFTEKEACLVCDAKYCKRCILKAMGAMPEGRKCLSCIGYSVDQSKRHLLGKCSRLLKGLLPESEWKQIMESELSYNQVSSEEIFVNGRPLCLEELMLLRSCPNPPRSLNSGHYWYDRVAGFWGKEGQKPCQIITPQLNVGNQKMKQDASNGNADVLINGREITKAELWMLQSAGVECAGSPAFWVDSEGNYQEEGMNVVKGKIWGRKRTKVLCALLSLPTPESPNPGKLVNGAIDSVMAKYPGQFGLCKILLVGNDQSGTSTIYKQARILYNVPFSEEEHQNIKLSIQSNLYKYLGRLLEWCQQFEEESLLEVKRRLIDQPGTSAMPPEIQEKTEYTIGPELKAFSDWLVNATVSGNLEIPQGCASVVEELWKDGAIQATYRRRDELDLPEVARYFLDKAVEVAREDYEPSDDDILYAEGISASNGLASIDFSFPHTLNEGFRDPGEQLDPVIRYQLIRVNAKNLGDNCKWLEMFEDVRIVLFCVSLVGYDEYKIDNTGELINKMLDNKRLFESVVTHPAFDEAAILLLLTKFDLLGKKIEQVPLTKCEWFHDFNPLVSKNSKTTGKKVSPLAQHAFHYIALKFKKLFKSLTGKKLYVWPVSALESETVDSALSYASEIITWEEEKLNLSLNYSSSESIDNEHSHSSYS